MRGRANQPANLIIHSVLFLVEDLLIAISGWNLPFLRVLFVIGQIGFALFVQGREFVTLGFDLASELFPASVNCSIDQSSDTGRTLRIVARCVLASSTAQRLAFGLLWWLLLIHTATIVSLCRRRRNVNNNQTEHLQDPIVMRLAELSDQSTTNLGEMKRGLDEMRICAEASDDEPNDVDDETSSGPCTSSTTCPICKLDYLDEPAINCQECKRWVSSKVSMMQRFL